MQNLYDFIRGHAEYVVEQIGNCKRINLRKETDRSGTWTGFIITSGDDGTKHIKILGIHVFFAKMAESANNSNSSAYFLAFLPSHFAVFYLF